MSNKSHKSVKANPWVLLLLTVLLAIVAVASCLFGSVDLCYVKLYGLHPLLLYQVGKEECVT